MLSLKKLKSLEDSPAPVLPFDEYQFPAADHIEESEEIIEEPKTDWYIPKKSWAQIFKERESGIIAGAWDDRIKAVEQKIGKEKWMQTHLNIAKNYNGNRHFEMYLIRLEQAI